MAINKVVINNTVELDLTEDTITAEDLRSGVTAHGKDGMPITGTLTVQKYYTGTTEPPASLGNDGDIYLKVVS